MSRSHNKKPPRGARGPGGRLLCYCGCGKEVQPPRRSWFSKECVYNYSMEHDGGFARREVQKRDKGVCANCGKKDCMWEADHIIEVVRGGAPLGLANLQTLCLACHKAKTARLAGERATERRAAQQAKEDAVQPRLFL